MSAEAQQPRFRFFVRATSFSESLHPATGRRLGPDNTAMTGLVVAAYDTITGEIAGGLTASRQATGWGMDNFYVHGLAAKVTGVADSAQVGAKVPIDAMGQAGVVKKLLAITSGLVDKQFEEFGIAPEYPIRASQSLSPHSATLVESLKNAGLLPPDTIIPEADDLNNYSLDSISPRRNDWPCWLNNEFG